MSRHNCTLLQIYECIENLYYGRVIAPRYLRMKFYRMFMIYEQMYGIAFMGFLVIKCFYSLQFLLLFAFRDLWKEIII